MDRTSRQVQVQAAEQAVSQREQKQHLTRSSHPGEDQPEHLLRRGQQPPEEDEEEGGKFGGASEKEIVNFPDFVRVLAHFRPIKKNAEKNKMNSRVEKLRCK